MDTLNQIQPPQPAQDIALNSTPLPARIYQANNGPKEKGRSKLYIAAASVVVGFFIISFITYKLTELKPESTSAAPPMIIKKAPLEKEKTASAAAEEEVAPVNELEELNNIDVGSVEGELQEIRTDEALL